MKDSESTQGRSYRMVARATAVAETEQRILDSAVRWFSTSMFDEVTLERIANEAGVTVQTVIRRFGSKDGLFAAAGEREGARIAEEREPDGDDGSTMEAAIHALVAHYEADGATVLNLLRQESRLPLIADTVVRGRNVHEAWVIKHCQPVLEGLRGAAHQRQLMAAIAATDIYVWKLLRLDRGMTQRDVEKAMLALLGGLQRTKGEK